MDETTTHKVTEEELKNAYRIIQLAAQQVEDPKAFADAVASSRRKKFRSVGTIRPYYTEQRARKLLGVLDDMIEKKIDKAFLCSQYKCKRDSLYQMIHQAWFYIIDHLDTEEKRYKKLKDQTHIRRISGAVMIKWKEFNKSPSRTEGPVKPMPAIDSATRGLKGSRTWKQDLMTFIEESKEGEAYVTRNLVLFDEDIDYIRGLISQTSQIKIIRLSENEIKLYNGTPPY